MLKPTVPKFGYHPSINRGYLSAVQRPVALGASAVQLWMGNSKGYASKILPKTTYEPVAEYVAEHDLFLISHSPYVLNFARPLQNDEKGIKALQRYVNDLVNVTNLGGVGSVLHMGSNVKELKLTYAQACANFADNLRWVIERKPKKAIIILENMAGGGTRMGCEMTEWAQFWNEHIKPDPQLRKHVRWCVDTAHLYAAGEYDLSLRTESLRFYRDFEKNIGWRYVLCIHFNGSKSALGSHHDNHADIGPEKSGLVETKGLRQFARIAGATGKPLICEVPVETHTLVDQFSLIESWFEEP